MRRLTKTPSPTRATITTRPRAPVLAARNRLGPDLWFVVAAGTGTGPGEADDTGEGEEDGEGEAVPVGDGLGRGVDA